MKFDLFFSLSHTPVGEDLPSENDVWKNFFQQIRAADEMGYKRAWIAESHLSSQAQKKNKKPVIPHWKGEVGINTNILQLSRTVYSFTKNIELGSAIMNLLSNGGPISHAENIATFLSQQQALEDQRKIHIGFSAGRFDFMSKAYGLKPRNTFEASFWKEIKSEAFAEASEIFLRLLLKEEISSDDISLRYLDKSKFKKEEDWQRAIKAMSPNHEISKIPLEKFYEFENIKVVPQEYDLKLLNLVLGSHSPDLQKELNQFLPLKVFNLSITPSDVIDETHKRMEEIYHSDGGQWQREYMPRTTFVFLNNDKSLSKEEQSRAAKEKAKKALTAYWQALEGTVDPEKIEGASGNALVGNVEEIKEQIQERFHPEDCLMLWFDFFNHNSDEVIKDMQTFRNEIAPTFDEKNWNNRVEFIQR